MGAGFVGNPGGEWKIFPGRPKPRVGDVGRKNITYGEFQVELERRGVDTSSQQFGVGGWFSEVQQAGGDFPRYLELVGGEDESKRKTHKEAIVEMKAAAERE